MKKLLLVILMIVSSPVIGYSLFGQEKREEQINKEVSFIEGNSGLTLTKHDWVELTGIATDGGGVLEITHDGEQIYKVFQEIGLSYGRLRTTLYLNNGIPIKIVESEENFEQTEGGMDFKKLNEVFKATVYFFDWEKDISEIKTEGKRVMSEGNCSNFDYEPIVNRALEALSK